MAWHSRCTFWVKDFGQSRHSCEIRARDFLVSSSFLFCSLLDELTKRWLGILAISLRFPSSSTVVLVQSSSTSGISRPRVAAPQGAHRLQAQGVQEVHLGLLVNQKLIFFSLR